MLVATARPLRAIQDYMQIIKFDAQTVSNGARIICEKQKKEYSIKHEDVENILSILNDYKI